MSDAIHDGTLKPRRLQDIKKPTVLDSQPGTIGSFFDIYGGQRELHSKEKLTPGPALVISSSGTDNGAYGFFDFDGIWRPLLRAFRAQAASARRSSKSGPAA